VPCSSDLDVVLVHVVSMVDGRDRVGPRRDGCQRGLSVLQTGPTGDPPTINEPLLAPVAS
jgi:hypothetical protein